jgi:hypothetical protein
MFNIGENAYNYEPYIDNSNVITIGDENNIIYGGFLDNENGILTITKKEIVFNGDASEAWAWDATNHRVSIKVENAKLPEFARQEVLCNIGTYQSSGSNPGTVFITTSSRFFYCPPSDINDLNSFR